MNTAQAINGEIRPYDWVIVAPFDEYGSLVGMVSEIIPLGSPEDDTSNTYRIFVYIVYIL